MGAVGPGGYRPGDLGTLPERSMTVPSIAVVYHSVTGRTKRLAEAIARGASAVEGCSVELIPTEELPSLGAGEAEAGRWDAVHDADALILGCPTYMGTVSAEFKRFMDQSGKVWLHQGWRDKLCAGFTHAGGLSGDKLNTLITLALYAAQHGMVWVNAGVFPGEFDGDDDGVEVNRMGAYIGAMAQSASKSTPETAPPEDDLRTGELLGERVARAAVRWGEAS